MAGVEICSLRLRNGWKLLGFQYQMYGCGKKFHCKMTHFVLNTVKIYLITSVKRTNDHIFFNPCF